MTVVATNAYSGPYVGNGSTTSFPFTFKAMTEGEVRVTADGEDVAEGDYSVSVAGGGGTITFDSAPASGVEILVLSNPDFSQDQSFTNGGAFLPEVHDLIADRGAVCDIYLKGETDRALKVPVGETAPLYDDFAETFRGSPGGNVQSVGLFTTLRLGATSIPAGTDTARSAGHLATGVGGAWYVADTDVDNAYLAANPKTSFKAGDDRGFRLSTDQLITVDMFGPDPLDCSAALQAFADFLELNIVAASWHGNYDIQTPVTLGRLGAGGFTETRSSTCSGRLNLRVTAPIAGAVISNQMHSGVVFDSIEINPVTGSLVWSNKAFDVGIKFSERSSFNNWHNIFVNFAKVAGCLVDGVAPNNTFASHFGTAFFYNCGSGSNWMAGANAANFASSTFTNVVRNGTAGDIGQTTTFTVTTMFPTSADIGASKYIFVGPSVSTMELYQIATFDRTAKTITVNGWVPVSIDTANTGTLYYVFGGGLVTVGGDSGVLTGNIAASLCGIGVNLSSLYPGRYTVITQENCVNISVGTGASDASVGGAIDGYFEGADCDLFLNMAPSGYGFKLASEWALSPSKVKFFMPRQADDSRALFNLPQAFSFAYNGYQNSYENGPEVDGSRNRATVGLDRPYGSTVPIVGDVVVIAIKSLYPDFAAANADFTRICGRFARRLEVRGTGNRGQPASIQVEPPAGQKINGVLGAALFSGGFVSQAVVRIEADPTASDNWLVTFPMGRPPFASATWNPPSVAAAASTSTTVTLTGAAVGDPVRARLSIALGGLKMFVPEVTAADTVTVTLFNPTGSAVDIGSGTLTAWLA